MTTQRAIKILKQMFSECKEGDKKAALSLATLALVILKKENEPAPSANDTSSNNNNRLHLNDNTDLQKCQEVIKEAKKRLLAIYEILSDEGRIAFELGELYHLLEGKTEDGDEDV